MLSVKRPPHSRKRHVWQPTQGKKKQFIDARPTRAMIGQLPTERDRTQSLALSAYMNIPSALSNRGNMAAHFGRGHDPNIRSFVQFIWPHRYSCTQHVMGHIGVCAPRSFGGSPADRVSERLDDWWLCGFRLGGLRRPGK